MFWRLLFMFLFFYVLFIITMGLTQPFLFPYQRTNKESQMATRKIFSVYDSKAEAFLQPFFADTEGIALRSFTASALAEEHNFFRFAEDYTLFRLGEFDDSTGAFKMLPTPESVVQAHVIKFGSQKGGKPTQVKALRAGKDK